MYPLYDSVAANCSRMTTTAYSTSFSIAIKALYSSRRTAIYNIYGFVRFADEIVDTFHDQDKEQLLRQFKADTFAAIRNGFSINPILHSFQKTVNAFEIDHNLIEAFFHSMEMDLAPQDYDSEKYKAYIYGSAEVVGLMCLHVFCYNRPGYFARLEDGARALGAAFQKVNFLRDMQADYTALHRVYFPGVNFQSLQQTDMNEIIADIQSDFDKAKIAIKGLPWHCRFGVFVAYKYYLRLFQKISRKSVDEIRRERIRIPDIEKLFIFTKAAIRFSLNIL